MFKWKWFQKQPGCGTYLLFVLELSKATNLIDFGRRKAAEGLKAQLRLGDSLHRKIQASDKGDYVFTMSCLMGPFWWLQLAPCLDSGIKIISILAPYHAKQGKSRRNHPETNLTILTAVFWVNDIRTKSGYLLTKDYLYYYQSAESLWKIYSVSLLFVSLYRRTENPGNVAQGCDPQEPSFQTVYEKTH